MPDLPVPTSALLGRASLFLDFDGTLCDFVAPDRDPEFGERRRALIRQLSDRLEGRLAIVSGRSLDTLERLVGIDGLDLTGSHGLERKAADGSRQSVDAPAAMAGIHGAVQDFAAPLDLVVETKPAGAALHFRDRPDAGPAAEAFAASLAEHHGLELRRGHMVAEVRVPGPHKGDAVRALMAEPPFDAGKPVFVGDDLTDEDGFAAAAALGGAGILVGDERATAARFRLASVDAVFDWLGQP